MKLPKAIFIDDKIYTDIEVKRPRGIVISEAQRLASDGDYYSSMYQFILGCTISVLSENEIIEDSQQLKRIIRAMPYRSAEYIAIQIMLMVDPKDDIEGIYYCPRCGKETIAELKDDIDTRDKISNLEVTIDTENSKTIYHNLIAPVIVQSKKDNSIVIQVDSIEIRTPTLNDCILTTKQTSLTGGLEFQIVLYKNCLEKVNGEIATSKFQAEWGTYVFHQMDTDDLKAIFEPIKQYGMQSAVEKRCMKCGKVWEATVNTTNFFVSGLPSH